MFDVKCCDSYHEKSMCPYWASEDKKITWNLCLVSNIVVSCDPDEIPKRSKVIFKVYLVDRGFNLGKLIGLQLYSQKRKIKVVKRIKSRIWVHLPAIGCGKKKKILVHKLYMIIVDYHVCMLVKKKS